jgi:hypothetical protein
MTEHLGGWVIVGDKTYRNQWVEEGRAIRQVNCAVCEDSGEPCPECDGEPIGIGFKGPFFEIVASPKADNA